MMALSTNPAMMGQNNLSAFRAGFKRHKKIMVKNEKPDPKKAQGTDSKENSDKGLNLEDLRHKVLAACLEDAVFEGWTGAMLARAADRAGAATFLAILFPKGVSDVLTFWSWAEDEIMVEKYREADPAPQRIRDKVRFLVKTRIEALLPHREAARRASATLALPIYGGLGARLVWDTADAIWRALGDKSTDFNFYTKRTSLSAVYLSTLGVWFKDEGGGAEEPYQATWDFLDSRIENIMQFEKFKAKMRDKNISPAGFLKSLAKMRYGARS
jgi:ubiquinone biosynthesis protein COQ9